MPFVFSSSASSQIYQFWQGNATSGGWQGATNWWKAFSSSVVPIAFGQQEWNNNDHTSQTNDNGSATLSTWRFVFRSWASASHTFSADAIRFLDFRGLDLSITYQPAATHDIDSWQVPSFRKIRQGKKSVFSVYREASPIE